jgi:thiamine biosynthesis lipoprotein
MIIQPRPFNVRKTLTVLTVLFVALYFYYQRPPPLRLWKMTGATMGTTYSIKILENKVGQAGVEALKTEVDARLAAINRAMSTYIPDSEISLFNLHASTEPFPVSDDFAVVTKLAIELCRDTGRAFDPTLDRLINRWGFGPQGPQKTPDPAEVARDLELTGCEMIQMNDAGGAKLAKAHPEATLNLNAIAKGWGVDEIARLIESKGITNYFVEIGGETFARGQSEKARPWRVGIDRPEEGAVPGENFDLVVELDGKALATSGNYRNFLVGENGQRINHILDPRSGQPSVTSLASVSVLAPDCATADAVATALFVMGLEEALAWVNEKDGIEAAFIEHTADGSLKTHFSSGFSSFIR